MGVPPQSLGGGLRGLPKLGCSPVLPLSEGEEGAEEEEGKARGCSRSLPKPSRARGRRAMR